MEMTSNVEIDQENIAMMETVDDAAKSTENSEVELQSSSSEDEVTSKIEAMEIENEKLATATTEVEDDEEVNQPQTVKKNNRILVSNTKKSFFVYLNLAKKCFRQYNAIELAAVGMAIPTVIKLAEVLKQSGIATEKEIVISTVPSKEPGTIRKKPRFEIVMVKANAHKENADKENKNLNTIDTAAKGGANEKVALAC